MRPSRSCVTNPKKRSTNQDGISHATRNKTKIADHHTTPKQLPIEYRKANPVHIEHKKVYEGRGYYMVHFDDKNLDPIYLHRDNGINLTPLIKDFVARGESTSHDILGELEWEVQQILDSRVENGQTEFLVKWKHWIGEPSWLNEDDCDCSGLIAAHENPKLGRIHNYNKNNRNLWIGSEQMHSYLKRLLKTSIHNANLLDTKDELCDTWHDSLEEGLNIGCTMFDHHWYVVFIFCNTNCVTKIILLADSLNTTITQKIRHHPILLRLKTALPGFPIRPMKITQMDRSDMCAFYVLAAIERGLFLFNPRAMFIPETINFHPARAEYLRSRYAPCTNTEISLSLRSKIPAFTCYICEFCREEFNDSKNLDAHIVRYHFNSIEGKEKNTSQSELDNIHKRYVNSNKYDDRLTKSFNDNYNEYY